KTIIVRELDLAEMKYQPDGAFAIAVNPKSGGIIAMSSRPNFDPASYESAAAEIFDRNLPIWSTCEPGSTFKIITLASALEENAIDVEADKFNDTGSIKYSCYKLCC